jgi:hypothetical protein
MMPFPQDPDTTSSLTTQKHRYEQDLFTCLSLTAGIRAQAPVSILQMRIPCIGYRVMGLSVTSLGAIAETR